MLEKPFDYEVQPGRGYSLDEIAKIIVVCRETIRSEIRDGALVATKVRSRWIVKGSDFVKYWDARREEK